MYARLNCVTRAHAVVSIGLVSPRFKKCQATPAIIAPLSPQSFNGGNIHLISVRSASMALSLEFAATPPPATTVVRPVSSTARKRRLVRVLQAVS